MRAAALISGLLCSGLLAACGAPADRPPVVWVTIDALGADYVGAYGRPGGITPCLDRLSREGTLLRQVWTSHTVTHLAVSALLTGRFYPYREPRRFHPNLPQLLARRGYRTAAFHRNPTLRSMPGWRGLFQEVHRPGDFSAEALHRELWPWLEAHREEPFFLYVHYMDVHAPYSPSPPLDRLVPSPGEEFQFYNGPLEGQSSRALTTGRGLYQGGIRELDSRLGDLIRRLRELDILDRALLVVLADHGDEFGEHGYLGHGHAVYRETARVPVLLRYPPAVPPDRILRGRIRTVDLLPTLLELLGQEAPEGLMGCSLTGSLPPGAPPPPPRPAYTLGKFPLFPVVRWTDRWVTVRRSRDQAELYRAQADPGQHRDLAADRPEVLRRESRTLDGWLQQTFPDQWEGGGWTGGFPEAQGEVLRELRSLGYVD